MSQPVHRRRFQAFVTPDGAIVVPAGPGRGWKPGQVLTVTIEGAGIAHDEDEVAAIAALQAEHPDSVRRCLAAQGALSGRRAGNRRGTGRRTSGKRR